MATVPTPMTAVAGTKLSAAGFNSGVRDPLDFIMDPPRCSVWANAAISCTNGTATLLTYDSEVEDTDTMHSTTTDTGRVVYKTTGRYLLHIYTCLVNPPTTYTQYTVNLRLNSGGSSGGGSSIRSFEFGSPGGAGPQQVISLSRFFTAGEYTETFLTQVSGVTRLTVAALGLYSTGFQAQWISAA